MARVVQLRSTPRYRPRQPRRFSNPVRAQSRSGEAVRVKICGLTTVKDARTALEEGADLLGMILWPGAKRSVTAETAKGIVAAAKSYKRANGLPKVVGVFVDETADQIAAMTAQSGIDLVQLHGAAARSALPYLDATLGTIYVLHASAEGEIQETAEVPVPVDYVLVDGMKGGSGQSFAYDNLRLPEWVHSPELVKFGWLLAGGLTPDNLAPALAELTQLGLVPHGVDVSTGVCDVTGVRKDRSKIRRFIRQASV